MIEQNVKFQETYKRLDALCKDMFSSKDGISTYISEMEIVYSKYSRLIDDWDFIYKQLKHMRWLRNQLAHNVGTFETDLCSQDDIDWLNDFYDSILKVADPLALVGKFERRIDEQQKRIKSIQATTYNTTAKNYNSKVSLWSKIKEKIKKLFL